MSKYPQTRRSVSMTGELYKALRAYGELRDLSMSEIVEEEMRRFLKLPRRSERFPAEAPVAEEKPEKPAKKAKPTTKEEALAWKPDQAHPWRSHDFSNPEPKKAVLKGVKGMKLTKEDEAILAKTDDELLDSAIENERGALEPKPTKRHGEKVTDAEFRKMLSDKPNGRVGYSPFYKHAPKKKTDPDMETHGVVETPKVLEKPDTSKFDEWADKQPKAKVDEGPARLATSNIVLF